MSATSDYESATSTGPSASMRPSASRRPTALTVPDAVAGGLLADASIGFEAVYMCNDGFVLQLLTFAGYPAPDEPERTMVGAGPTHLSIAVDDLAAAQAAVKAAGGTGYRRPRLGIRVHGARPRRAIDRADPLECSTRAAGMTAPRARIRLISSEVRRPSLHTGRGTTVSSTDCCRRAGLRPPRHG